MQKNKRPEANLKLQYRKVLELGFIAALVLLLLFFHAIPNFDLTPSVTKARAVEIKIEDIPPTEQIKRPPPPARPSIPIPTEREDVPEDITIETTDLDLTEIPPPPEPPAEEDEYANYVFIPYDEPPVPVGGMAAILENLKYPEIAKKAGLEARVVVGVLVDERGNPVKTQILMDAGNSAGFEQAASDAVMSVKWKPAKQRDKPVKVWVSVPVRFSLKGAT